MTTSAYLMNAEGNAWLQTHVTNASLYLAIHTAEPTTLDDPSTELVGSGYARQPITFGNPSGKTVVQSNNVIFSGLPAATASWVTIRHTLSGGAALYALQLATPVTFALGQQWRLPVGSLALSL